MAGDPFETIDVLTKALLGIALYKIPPVYTMGSIIVDVVDIQKEARDALSISGYDFETLMHDQAHDPKGNAEA